MISINPRYGHRLVPCPGYVYSIANDQPPTELKPFWPGSVFWCRSDNDHIRYTDQDIQALVGAVYVNETIAVSSFCSIKYKNVRVL